MAFILAENENKDVILSLRNDDDDDVLLIATESDGTEWDVMVFKDGRFGLVECISDKVDGIDVDTKGRIREAK